MKLFKLILTLIAAISMLLVMTSCSGEGGGGAMNGGGGFVGAYGESASGGDYDYESGTSSPDASAPDSDGSGDTTEDGETTEDKTEPDQITTRPAGLITAGAWNDNDNYEFWKTMFDQGEESTGKFYGFTGDNSWGFYSYSRIKVTVKNGDSPVAGAKVTASNESGNTLFSAVTDAAGVAYLFTNASEGSVQVVSGEYTASADFTGESRVLDISLDGNAEKKNIIDIMFVVDVTGSMGDEISYLKNELADVVGRVAAANESSVINLALLFYRDNGDSEKFAYYDFINVSQPDGLTEAQAAIDSQYASGGGDYEEAVDEALELAVSKQWNTAATTKIIFQVLDAPPHSSNANKEKFNSAVDAAAEKGIRICPIICSGADTTTEYVMREAAIHTGGTFIFVTDDSGIGSSHHDPNLPNVTVEALNSLMVRLINGYHTGTFAPAVDWRQEVK